MLLKLDYELVHRIVTQDERNGGILFCHRDQSLQAFLGGGVTPKLVGFSESPLYEGGQALETRRLFIHADNAGLRHFLTWTETVRTLSRVVPRHPGPGRSDFFRILRTYST